MKKVVKNIFTILTVPEKQKLCLLALADILVSILDIIFLIALLYVVNFYTQTEQTRTGRKFLPAIFNTHPVSLIIVFFLLFAAKNIFGFIVSKVQYRFIYNVASRISKQNLVHYLESSYHNYINTDSSAANRQINQEPIEFAHYVLNGAQQTFSQGILVLMTIVAVVIFNPLLFPLLILLLTPPVVLTAVLMKRKLGASGTHVKETSEKAMQHLQEALNGYVESNVYLKKSFFINRYHRFQVKLNNYLSERLIIQSMPSRLIEIFAVFGLLLLVIIHFIVKHQHAVQLVTIGALMVAAYKIIPGIVKITNTIGQVKAYAYSAEDLAAATRLLSATVLNNEPLSNIVFDNVSFNYPGRKCLDSFSFSVQKGDFMIVSGVSGKGKTTFINLLLGFLTPASGNILINNKVSDDKMRQLYWSKIAYAKQQLFFLHTTIIENICLRTQADDEIKFKKIIEIAGINKMLCSMPKGMETLITENGKNFSGGQRQRIAFARALYKDFDLLILDEPFSELDEASEVCMLQQLQKIAASGKMIILVTHNKTALAFGNKKILMNEQ